VRTFVGQEGSSDADVRTFGVKKSKFIVCQQSLHGLLRTKVEPVWTFCGQVGRGSVLCGRLLWNFVRSIANN